MLLSVGPLQFSICGIRMGCKSQVQIVLLTLHHPLTLLMTEIHTSVLLANATAPFIYSWYKNGSQIANANSSSYSTPSLTSSDDGNIYSCKITNCSSAYIISSENATLTLATGCIGVSISNSLSDQSAKVGEKVTWSASAYGTVPFSYQWYKNGS